MKHLQIQKVDLEYKLGLVGKNTSPHKFAAFLLSAAITAGLIVGLSFFPDSITKEGPLSVLMDRGVIPYVTLLALNWGIILLWLKGRKINGQRKAIQFLRDFEFRTYTFHADNAAEWMRWLESRIPAPHDFILTNRLYAAFASLHALRDPSSLPGLVNSHAETDEIQSEETFTFPSMLLFLVPILGFIGTVIGLSQSIGGFGSALSENAQDLGILIASLQSVTGGLAVAFDTTLFALICALVLQIYLSMIRNKETAFLEDCTAFFQRDFFPNLTFTDSRDTQAQGEQIRHPQSRPSVTAAEPTSQATEMSEA